MGARWYDSSTGRWLSADTIVPQPGNPQNLNRMLYAGNNPLRFRDPTGRYSEDELHRWGFSDEVIARWKADKVWWEFISAAQLGDLAKALVPYLVDKPREVAAYFFLIPEEYNLPELLQIEGFSSLEQFRQYTTDRELWFRNERWEWQKRTYCTAFMSPQQPELRIWFDAGAVDWQDVGLDVASLATMGIAQAARSGRLGLVASRAEAAISGLDWGGDATEIMTGQNDWRTDANSVLSAAGTALPELAPVAAVFSLLIDLSAGIKAEYR